MTPWFRSTDRATRWLLLAAIVHVGVGLLLIGFLVWREMTPRDAALRTAVGRSIRLTGEISDDSWGPMLLAYQSHARNPSEQLYGHFFSGTEKFQYPPTSLLVLDLFPSSRTRDVAIGESVPVRRVVVWFSRAAVVISVLAAWMIFERVWRTQAGIQRRTGIGVRLLLFGLLGVTFHPLVSAYAHGQIQVFINLALALAGLAVVARRDVWAGVCVGLCCLFKPHFGLVVVWAALRRRWSLIGGLLGVVFVGGVLSIAKYGLQAHFDYLEVVRTLSRRGEAYWPNQSINGLLNRLSGNGDPLVFSPDLLPPFHPAIYGATVVAALVLLGVACWPRSKDGGEAGRGLDFFGVVAAITLASPVAWTHHYGAFFPILALLLAVLAGSGGRPRWTVMAFAGAYLAVANIFLFPQLMRLHPFMIVVFTHTFLGGILAFALCTYFRIRGVAPAPAATPNPAAANLPVVG